MEITLDRLKMASALHMDHYGGKRLQYSCIKATGIYKTLAHLNDPGSFFEVMDVSGGYASSCLGANNRDLWQSLQEKIPGCSYVTDELSSLERACFLNQYFGVDGQWTDHFPYGQYHISGRNSGSEGLELAMRLLLESLFDKRRLAKFPNKVHKNIILAFEGGWHGWTGGIISLLNRRYYTNGLQTQEGDIKVKWIPFGDEESLELFFKQFGNQIAGVFVEPIQGDAGIIEPPLYYLRRLSILCQQFDALLIADEVLTFAKTGQFFAMRDTQGPIHTDISIIGKSLGMGLIPISLVITKKIFNVRPCGAVSTNDLRDISCAVMRSGLHIIENQKLLVQSKTHGKFLHQQLNQLVQLYPGIYRECRGLGHLFGVELTEQATQKLVVFRETMIRHGIYTEFMAGAGKRSNGLRYIFPTMRIAPPLIISTSEIGEMFDRLVNASCAFRLLM